MKPFRLCLLAALFTVCLLGQDAPEIRAHTFEVGAFPGASYGIDDFRFQFGANVSYAFTKHLLPYVEYSYFPGIEHSRQNPALPKTIDTFTLNIHDFHAGLHYRFTIPESRFAPYLAFGMGTVFTGRVKEKSVDSSVSPPVVTTPLGGTLPGTTNFAVNFGGGIRYYVKQNWGLRVEAKAYKPTGSDTGAGFNQVFGKV